MCLQLTVWYLLSDVQRSGNLSQVTMSLSVLFSRLCRRLWEESLLLWPLLECARGLQYSACDVFYLKTFLRPTRRNKKADDIRRSFVCSSVILQGESSKRSHSKLLEPSSDQKLRAIEAWGDRSYWVSGSPVCVKYYRSQSSGIKCLSIISNY